MFWYSLQRWKVQATVPSLQETFTNGCLYIKILKGKQINFLIRTYYQFSESVHIKIKQHLLPFSVGIDFQALDLTGPHIESKDFNMKFIHSHVVTQQYVT